jgi:hypothetical protein
MLLGAGIALAGALQGIDGLFLAGWLCMAPCVLFNVWTAFSYAVNGFDYSWLGRKVPGKPPAEWQPAQSMITAIRIARRFHGWGTVQIGRGGFVIGVLALAPVFIRSNQIVDVAVDSWLLVRIDHTSHEIHSPIYVWRSVGVEMERYMPELSLGRPQPPDSISKLNDLA